MQGNGAAHADPRSSKPQREGTAGAAGDPAPRAAGYSHCAKASELPNLDPASWPAPLRISFGKLLARKLGGGAELEGSIDRMIEDDYKTNL